ncbi:hypothetical protein [Streptomyces sp. NPDC021622]|uniref:hypothetical protein n=1 Tax=Streptomyces sp. NPDC021622 TaxID=3155013 RepID=UPI0033CD310B
MSEETPVEETEPDEPPSRIAGAFAVLVLGGAAVLVVRLVVTRVPYIAYFVAGVIACVVWQRARAWLTKRRGGDAEESEEQEPPDVGEALRALGKGGNHVLLTALRKELGVDDTKAVRALLKTEKIRVRSGVRTPKGNGPGVHHEDIPPAPPESNQAHGDGCCCRSANNTNNVDEGPSQKGLRAEPIGQAGTLVHDPAEEIRHHEVRGQ